MEQQGRSPASFFDIFDPQSIKQISKAIAKSSSEDYLNLASKLGNFHKAWILLKICQDIAKNKGFIYQNQVWVTFSYYSLLNQIPVKICLTSLKGKFDELKRDNILICSRKPSCLNLTERQNPPYSYRINHQWLLQNCPQYISEKNHVA